jgi:hypothetical protein
MPELIRFFLDLALLRRKPQDLPDSLFLLQVLLLLNLALSFPLGLGVFDTAADAFLAALLELVLSAGLLFAALQLQGRSSRWRQSYSALLGIGIVGTLLTMVYRALAVALGTPVLAATLDLVVFLWLMLAMGHVVRHTFEIPLPFGILIVFAYTMFLLGLVAQWFAPELAAQAAS